MLTGVELRSLRNNVVFGVFSLNEPKICKINKIAKNHFSGAEKGSQGVFGGFGSGPGILIRATEVPWYPPNRQKWVVLVHTNQKLSSKINFWDFYHT